MNSFVSIARKLIPFASPGTALLQDLLYTVAIIACIVVLATERLQRWSAQQAGANTDPNEAEARNINGEERQPLGIPHEDDQNQVFVFEDENSGSDNDDEHELQDGGNPRPPFDGEVANNDAPGPAAPARNAPPARALGAKKAKSLARKDQRRAYHEFLRNQGAAQRAQEAEGAADREALLSVERERRAAATSAMEAKRAAERQAKRDEETRHREREILKREGPVRLCQQALEEKGMVSVWEIVDGLREVDVDEVWVERILRTAGVIGRGVIDGTLTMMTSTGWIVRIGADDMQRVYQTVADHHMVHGKSTIDFDEVGEVLQDVLAQKRQRH